MRKFIIIFSLFILACVFSFSDTIKFVSGDFYPPFIWVDASGNPQGFSVEFLDLLEKETGLDFELELMPFSEALERIENGKADMINLIFKTPEREKYILFSKPLFEIESNIYYRKNLNVANISDLNPYIVGAVKGDANVEIAMNINPKLVFRFFDSFSDLIEAVKNMEIDVFLMENFTASYYFLKNDLVNTFKKIDLSKQYVYLGISKNREDLLTTVDLALDSLKSYINDFLSLYYTERKVSEIPRWILIIGFVALIAGTFIFYVVVAINNYLKKEVETKTKDVQLKNEELQSAYEEITAMNQELSATNEELESAYEEISNYQNQLDEILSFTSRIASENMTEETYFKESSKFLLDNIHGLEFSMFIGIEDGVLNALVYSKNHNFTKFRIENFSKEIIDCFDENSKLLEAEVFTSKYQAMNFKDYILKNELFPSKILTYPIRIGQKIHSFLALGIQDEKLYLQNKVKIEKILKTLSIFFNLNEYSKEKAVFQKKLIIVFTKALEYYDTYTKGHSVNVANYASKISEKLGFESERISKIYWAGLVHDVGKIFVPQSVLNKSEKLTDEEYELIKLHPLKGYELISEIEGLKDIAEIVLYHHERYDGKGYPYGKKGDEIPIESRILCVADSFDAMTSDRPYKKSLTLEEAIEELRKNSGTQFDPEIVSVLIDILLSEFNHRSSMNA